MARDVGLIPRPSGGDKRGSARAVLARAFFRPESEPE